ncbi:MAG: fructose transporter subunit [Myxococcales bacterium]|nr:fructose transporter subunit [Myxococcales bacterium]
MSVTGVVVITHGNAAEDMVQAAERVVGRPLDVRTISVPIGEPRSETEIHIERVVIDLHAEEVLFLTDLEGSTPYNLCCKRCGGRSVVLSGMNLPMLFKLATADREHGALSLAEELRATGLKSIHIRTAMGTK